MLALLHFMEGLMVHGLYFVFQFGQNYIVMWHIFVYAWSRTSF
jgi:hypothetical protein